MTLGSSKPYLDLSGNKIPISEDFDSSGKISMLEIISKIKENVLDSDFIKSPSVSTFIKSADALAIQLKGGDTVAIICVILTFVTLLLSFLIMSLGQKKAQSKKAKDQKSVDSKDEKIPLRDFTIEQLRDFDGTNGKPIYISLRFEVYDVSNARDFYGVGSGYHCFAGREASRAMAKLSFDEEDLSSTKLEDLGPFELDTLDQWISKFRDFKSYPVIGKVTILPSILPTYKCSELVAYKGKGPIPAGRVDAPILIGIKNNVLDVSFGGKEMYGESGPYHIFAGIDASRALAKMSFDESNINSHDLSDLDANERKTLDDWEKKFLEVKKYPIVGKLAE